MFPDPVNYSKEWDKLAGVKAAFRPSEAPWFDAVYFSCDALKVAVDLGRDSVPVLSGLSNNSESKVLPSGIVIKYRKVSSGSTKAGMVLYTFEYLGFDLFYLVLNYDPTLDRRHFFEVTGTCFRLCHPSFVLDCAEALGLTFTGCVRVDYALDLTAPSNLVLSDLWEWLRANGKNSRLYNSRENGVETVYLGDPSSKNDYRVIRVYNKNADTEFKGKANLYPLAGMRTRVEVEYREQKAVNFDCSRLLDIDYAWRLFCYDVRSFLLVRGVPEMENLLAAKRKDMDMRARWDDVSSAATRFDRAMFGAYASRLFRRGASVVNLCSLMPLAWEDFCRSKHAPPKVSARSGPPPVFVQLIEQWNAQSSSELTPPPV